MKQLFFALLMCSTSISYLSAQEKNGNSPKSQTENSKSPTENTDETFAKKATEGGLAEVMFGKLGQNQGSSAEVKDYGKMMVNDHTKANQELKSLASKHNITLPKELPADMQKQYDAVKSRSGAEFDKAFIDQMITDHKKVIALFEDEVLKGQNEEMKAWAKKNLPTLKQHLEHAMRIQNNLK